MSRYRMFKYVLEPVGDNKYWYLCLWMCDTYAPILEKCFPSITFQFKPGISGTCDTTIALKENPVLALQGILEIFKTHLLLVKNEHVEPYFSNELVQCYALDFNLESNIETDRFEYTKYGRLEHLAKEGQSEVARAELIEAFANICEKHPLYKRADIVMPVPPNPLKTFHLPVLLTKELARKTGKKDGCSMIKKTKETPRLQELPIDDKPEALKGAIKITGNVSGKDVIIVDDLYQSGFTMWTVAKLLKQNGAKTVLGLACVKSLRDTDNQ